MCWLKCLYLILVPPVVLLGNRVNRAEMVYGIFDQLEVVRISEIVKWVNEFYSHGEYANRPFIEALEFAYRFAEASGVNMWEKYENLKFDKIKPGKE